jgi:hypothetical protein
MRLGVPFISPRGLGAVGDPFGRPWLPSVRGCTGLSGTHRTVNSAQAGREQRIPDWLLYCSGGTRLSGTPLDHWPEADVAASRCAASTSDCLPPRADRPVNYS